MCLQVRANSSASALKNRLLSLFTPASTLAAWCFCSVFQKFPKDGVKKLVLQLEKQKVLYEEKALVALQKATQDKTEAVCKVATLQVKRISMSGNMTYGPISYVILSFFATCGHL